MKINIKKKQENSSDDLNKQLVGHLQGSENSVIMMKIPTDSYFHTNSSSIRTLTEMGLEGVYISFNRPFRNIKSLLNKSKIKTNKILFIDLATPFANASVQKDKRCINLSSDIKVRELAKKAYDSLGNLNGRRKFIFVDSLTTMALYKPLSDISKFSQHMIESLINQDEHDVALIFNVSKDLAERKFIKDLSVSANGIIS